MNASDYKILSIDGGGIRGVIPAALLSRLETDNSKAQKLDRFPLRRFFHMVAGTSTGGIIALAIASETRVSEIYKLYLERGKSVFEKRLFRGPKAAFGSKYKNSRLEEEFKSTFTEKTLSDCKCDVCVPAVDIATGEVKVFTKHTDGKAKIWQVALATTAAPTYFPTVTFSGESMLSGTYADGGLWANNPALVAVSEAVSRGIEWKAIRVLSLGTGAKTGRAKIDKRPSGLLSWGGYLVECIFNAQSAGVDIVARRLLARRYLRLNLNLETEEASLDSIRSTKRLSQLANTPQYCDDEAINAIERHFLCNPTVLKAP